MLEPDISIGSFTQMSYTVTEALRCQGSNTWPSDQQSRALTSWPRDLLHMQNMMIIYLFISLILYYMHLTSSPYIITLRQLPPSETNRFCFQAIKHATGQHDGEFTC